MLHSFSGGTDGEWPLAGVIAANGNLYGTTAFGGIARGGTAFALDLTTGAETVLYSFCSQANCADGDYPQAGLIHFNGKLYGTTTGGGSGTG